MLPLNRCLVDLSSHIMTEPICPFSVRVRPGGVRECSRADLLPVGQEVAGHADDGPTCALRGAAVPRHRDNRAESPGGQGMFMWHDIAVQTSTDESIWSASTVTQTALNE